MVGKNKDLKFPSIHVLNMDTSFDIAYKSLNGYPFELSYHVMSTEKNCPWINVPILNNKFIFKCVKTWKEKRFSFVVSGIYHHR